jgi:glycosyltransferase involved in cell wall biosynthesis
VKIGLLHNLYGGSGRGGAEKIVEMMAANYLASGQEVFLITTKLRGQKTTPTESERNGLKIYYLNSHFYNLDKHSQFYRAGWHVANIFSWRKYGQIKKILGREKPDLVITHNLMGLGFMAPLAIRSAGIRQEHFLHDIQLLHPSGLLIWGQEKKVNGLSAHAYQALTRALFGSPAMVISPSRWLWEFHKKRGFFKNSEKEIRPLPLKIGETTNLWGAPKNQPAQNFLFVGQIESHKGILFLIRTFQKTTDQKLKLRIVGDGQKLTAAKKAAQDDSRIEFLGRLDATAVQKIMGASDCLIVPSLCYENSPTVIYEAHAASLPVIAADLGGIPELMGPDDKLFKPGDNEDLRKKIWEIKK